MLAGSEGLFMDLERYLQERLEDQIDWYDRKSGWNQRLYKRLRLLEVISAASIPLLTGFIADFAFMSHVVAVIGVAIAVISGAFALFKFQENWIEYRTTAESLKHQKYLFLTQTSPYDGGDAFHVLVETVEGLISQENSKWTQYVKQQKDKAKKS
jgi:hypothetical protein